MLVSTLSTSTTIRLATLPTNASLRAAAMALMNPLVGLVVQRTERTIAGVVSKSDLIRHLSMADSMDTALDSLMQAEVVTCTPSDDLQSTWELMAQQQLQNIPVTRPDGIPIGVLDIRDALKALLDFEVFTEQELTRYVSGVGYR